MFEQLENISQHIKEIKQILELLANLLLPENNHSLSKPEIPEVIIDCKKAEEFPHLFHSSNAQLNNITDMLYYITKNIHTETDLLKTTISTLKLEKQELQQKLEQSKEKLEEQPLTLKGLKSYIEQSEYKQIIPYNKGEDSFGNILKKRFI